MIQSCDVISISVIIPLYNASDYILETLNSVLNQSYLPKEILIINDGSTDDGPEKIRGFLLHFGTSCKIHLIDQNNKGHSAARNLGIQLSKSSWIAFLDSDDIWHPHKLEQQVKALKSNPDVGLIYCDYGLIDSTGKTLTLKVFHPKKHTDGHIGKRLLIGNLIAGSGSAVLIPKRILIEVGGFPESYPTAEDWDLWYRIASKYQVHFCKNVLVFIRRHSTSVQTDQSKMIIGSLYFYLHNTKRARLFSFETFCSIRHFALSNYKAKQLWEYSHIYGDPWAHHGFLRSWLIHRIIDLFMYMRVIYFNFLGLVNKCLAR